MVRVHPELFPRCGPPRSRAGREEQATGTPDARRTGHVAIDVLMGVDEDPFRQEGEQRQIIRIAPNMITLDDPGKEPRP